jgi:hypothetical protein
MRTFTEKTRIMDTEKTKKMIDLKTDTKRMLTYRTIEKSVSPKRYIGLVPDAVADEQEDEILLELSAETEGLVSGQEKSDFVNMLHMLHHRIRPKVYS